MKEKQHTIIYKNEVSSEKCANGNEVLSTLGFLIQLKDMHSSSYFEMYAILFSIKGCEYADRSCVSTMKNHHRPFLVIVPL